MWTRRTHRVWGVVTCILVITGLPLLAWSGYSLGATAYALWKHGVEKRASVIRLESARPGRGGTVFDYIIEIDGRQSRQSFRVRLPAGCAISVLTLPGHPDIARASGC